MPAETEGISPALRMPIGVCSEVGGVVLGLHDYDCYPRFEAMEPLVAGPESGGTGIVRVAARVGGHRVAMNSTLMTIPSSLTLAGALARPHLEMTAWSGAIPCARHHAREYLWDIGRKELIDPVELVVSELVTNAVRASGAIGLVPDEDSPVVRLWVTAEDSHALVLVWDANSAEPYREEPHPDAESGRGLLLVETLSVGWGSFKLADEPGKVVWALCQS